MGARWKFTIPQNHLGKPLLEGFVILKIDNLDTSGANIHMQAGYFQEGASGEMIGFMPLMGENLRVEGAAYSALRAKKGDVAKTLEQQIMEEAYNAVVVIKGTAWAGMLKLA